MSDVADPDHEALIAALVQCLCGAVHSARPEIEAARAEGGQPAAEAVVREVLTSAIEAIVADMEEGYRRAFARIETG